MDDDDDDDDDDALGLDNYLQRSSLVMSIPYFHNNTHHGWNLQSVD